MLEPIVDSATVAWPLALTLASVAVADRVRASRRRERLNRALHELRRPLQALTLSPPSGSGHRSGQLELALEALGDLDRALNGGSVERRPRAVDPRLLAEDAVRRWGAVAAAEGRRIELRWRATGSRVVCEAAAIARALDNLIANALEHGTGPVSVEGLVRAGRLRLLVTDGGRSDSPASPLTPDSARRPAGAPFRWRTDPRRGHGLGLAAEVAAEHGGRFAACRHDAGACAVIELPLAPG